MEDSYSRWLLRARCGSMAGMVVAREFAVRLVEEEIERQNRERDAAQGGSALRCAVTGVEEHELVWVVFWNSERYVRTGDTEYVVGGNGPFLVDRADGGLYQVGPVAYVTGEWEADYRARIRGLAMRDPVDELHDELRRAVRARGRVNAARLLSLRVGGLEHGQILEYVTALQDGAEPRAELVAVVEAELSPPRAEHVVTIRRSHDD